MLLIEPAAREYAQLNPFVLARDHIELPWGAQRVLADLDALIEDGFELDGRHYHVFGGRLGNAFSMSLGMPVLGGGAPVLRGRVRAAPTGTTLELTVGARIEVVTIMSCWGLLTVFGGGYQLVLQARRALAGEASWSAVAEVLPGIGIMAAMWIFGVFLWRRRSTRPAQSLIEIVHQFLLASEEGSPASSPSFSPSPIS